MRRLRKVKCATCGSEPGVTDICQKCRATGWVWFCETHDLPAQEEGCERCAYDFQGQRYFTPQDLATALKTHWDDALKQVILQPLETWAESGLIDPVLAAALGRCSGASKTHPNAALAGALSLMNPQITLPWKGRSLWRDDFVVGNGPAAHPDSESLNEILSSGLVEWLRHRPAGAWLQLLLEQCRRRGAILGLTDLQLVNPAQWWWLMADSVALRTVAEKIRERYLSSKDSRIAALFSKQELSEEDALLLGNAPVDSFLTAEDAWRDTVQSTLVLLERLDGRAQHSPSTYENLEMLTQELSGSLSSMRERRERWRSHRTSLTEPPQLLAAIDIVKNRLHQRLIAHRKVKGLVNHIQKLVDAGHIRMAAQAAEQAKPELAEFSDLTVDFVADATTRYRKRYKKLVFYGVLFTFGLIVFLLIVMMIR